MNPIDRSTISDFGEQWIRFWSNDGHYGSVELLNDIMQGLMSINDLNGSRVADIGSGTGRIVAMLFQAGVSEVFALEPSRAFDVMVDNTQAWSERIHYLNSTGDKLPGDLGLDVVLSFGVLHHIVDPRPVVDAAYRALKPGGKVVFWVYAHEGNELYVALVLQVRRFSVLLPDRLLVNLCTCIDYLIEPYLFICRYLPLPMRDYFLGHYRKLSRSVRRLTLFDQMNPAYAKYYKREEVVQLVSGSGFDDIKLVHRHGYSWTVRGQKPLDE